MIRAARLEPASLRTLDAIHLATALTLGTDLAGLVTYDGKLAEAAVSEGFDVLAPSCRPLRGRWSAILEHRSVGSSEHRSLSRELEGEPISCVDQAVMATTQQHQVREPRSTSLRPVHNVMGVTPRMWSVTPGEAAVPIPAHDRPSDRRRHHRGSPSHIERSRSPRHHHPHHRGITGKPSCRPKGDRTHMIELRTGGEISACTHAREFRLRLASPARPRASSPGTSARDSRSADPARASAETVRVRCGRSPATAGRGARSSH